VRTPRWLDEDASGVAGGPCFRDFASAAARHCQGYAHPQRGVTMIPQAVEAAVSRVVSPDELRPALIGPFPLRSGRRCWNWCAGSRHDTPAARPGWPTCARPSHDGTGFERNFPERRITDYFDSFRNESSARDAARSSRRFRAHSPIRWGRSSLRRRTPTFAAVVTIDLRRVLRGEADETALVGGKKNPNSGRGQTPVRSLRPRGLFRRVGYG
jgi:hypothetical protein